MSDYRKPRRYLTCEQQPVHTFGLDKLYDTDATIARLTKVLDQIL